MRITFEEHPEFREGRRHVAIVAILDRLPIMGLGKDRKAAIKDLKQELMRAGKQIEEGIKSCGNGLVE